MPSFQDNQTTIRNAYDSLTDTQKQGFGDVNRFSQAILKEQSGNLGAAYGGGRELNLDAAIGNIVSRGPNPFSAPNGGGANGGQGSSGFADQPGTGGNQPGNVSTDAIVNGGSGQQGSSSYDSLTQNGLGTNYGEQLRSRVDERFAEFQPKSEEEILQQEMDAVQQQVDAINAVYDQRRLDAIRGNRDRSGRTGALNVASGTAFDPIGAARVDAREAENQQILDAVEKERLAEIANIMAAARGQATSRIERQADRFIELANSEVDNLAKAFDLSVEEAAALRSEAISRAQLTGQLGDDPTLALRQFLSDEGQRRFDNTLSRDQFGLDVRQTDANIRQIDSNIYNAEERLKIAQQEAARAGAELVQLPNGDFGYFDADTRQFVSLGNYAAPRYSGGGGGGGSTNDLFARGQISIYDLPDAFQTMVENGMMTLEQAAQQSGVEAGFANPFINDAYIQALNLPYDAYPEEIQAVQDRLKLAESFGNAY